MRKQEFLARLRKGLSGLPQAELEERLAFYSEMIDDRMEEGVPEEEAVAAVGDVEWIFPQTRDTPSSKAPTESIPQKKRLRAWEIVLLVLGSPIWLSLLIAGFAVVLSLYMSVWAVLVSLWAVFGSLVGCAVGGILAGIGFLCVGNGIPGLALLGAGIVCAGLSVFAFCGCKAATTGLVWLTKKLTWVIKNCFVKKEAV